MAPNQTWTDRPYQQRALPRRLNSQAFSRCFFDLLQYLRRVLLTSEQTKELEQVKFMIMNATTVEVLSVRGDSLQEDQS